MHQANGYKKPIKENDEFGDDEEQSTGGGEIDYSSVYVHFSSFTVSVTMDDDEDEEPIDVLVSKDDSGETKYEVTSYVPEGMDVAPAIEIVKRSVESGDFNAIGNGGIYDVRSGEWFMD